MSKIKSALELALERTAAVPVDKEAVRKEEFIRKGKSRGRTLPLGSQIRFSSG